jgi:hypothetical protein
MKKEYVILVVSLTIALLSTSCIKKSNNNNISVKDKELVVINNFDCSELVLKWNEAHNSKDIYLLSNLYDSVVEYYGKTSVKENVINDKSYFFIQHPDYNQSILGDVIIEKISLCEVKCSFSKISEFDNNLSDYPSYLVFKLIDDSWKIIVESDSITDENLIKKDQNKSDLMDSFISYMTIDSIESEGVMYKDDYVELNGFVSKHEATPYYNAEDIPDFKEEDLIIYYTVQLEKPIYVFQGYLENEYNEVSEVQIYSTYKDISEYDGKKVKISGNIFKGTTWHHRREFLTNIFSIDVILDDTIP